MPQEECERISVHLAPPRRMRAQRLELGAEQKRRAHPAVIQRFFAQSIAGEMQHALVSIPHRERKHSVEALKRILDTPHLDRSEEHFGVAVPAPAVPTRGQLAAELGEVVNLTVIRNDIAL